MTKYVLQLNVCCTYGCAAPFENPYETTTYKRKIVSPVFNLKNSIGAGDTVKFKVKGRNIEVDIDEAKHELSKGLVKLISNIEFPGSYVKEESEAKKEVNQEIKEHSFIKEIKKYLK